MAEKKILYVATVVKTHIMHFHVPYIKMMHDQGWHTAVAGRNDYSNPSDLNIPFCDDYFDVSFERNPFKFGNIKAYRMLKKVVENGEYDIVHCHTPVAGILTRLACRNVRKNGTKVIYTAHGFHFYKGAPFRNWLLYFTTEWISSFFTDVLITINKEDYELASRHLHASRTLYVPGVGVDVKKFGVHNESRESMRRSLNVSEDDFLLLTVAELTPGKNHEMVLEALAATNNPHIRFLAAGSGIHLKRLTELTHSLGLDDRVTFLGYRSDVKELYAAADAFVFPSLREGLSLALMEAMASGLPAVATRIRGNTDLITDGVEGMLVPATVDGIASGIKQICENPEMRVKFGEAAKKKVQQFGIENTLKLVDEIYAEVISV